MHALHSMSPKHVKKYAMSSDPPYPYCHEFPFLRDVELVERSLIFVPPIGAWILNGLHVLVNQRRPIYMSNILVISPNINIACDTHFVQ